MSQLDQKIDNFRREYQALAQEALQNEQTRRKLLDVAKEGLAMLESPTETIWKLIMQPSQTSSLMTIIHMGLLPTIVNSKEPVSADELAKSSGSEKLLIVRLMRPLTALGFFKETDIETYAAAPVSATLMDPTLLGGYKWMYTCGARSMAEMPFYLEKTGFKNVSGPPGPFEHALNYSQGHFRWLVDTPDMLNSFNSFMSGQRMYRSQWYDAFPVEEILYPKEEGESHDDAPEEPILFIDVAGGGGHDIEAFHKSYPHAPGKLVLQDLPETIDQITQLSPTITRMKHDFFMEQPIKGARAYYFRSIFHDWPDQQCIQIMKNTAAAMKRGYSKLLIFEFILPEKNVPFYPATLDINLMSIFNGMERTRSQWIALLHTAGLEISKIWSSGDHTEGLIEARLK